MKVLILCTALLAATLPQQSRAQDSDVDIKTAYCVGVLTADRDYKENIKKNANASIDANRKRAKDLEAEVQSLHNRADYEKDSDTKKIIKLLIVEKNTEIKDASDEITTNKFWIEKLEKDLKNSSSKIDLYLKRTKDILAGNSVPSTTINSEINKGSSDQKTCTDYIDNVCNQDYATAQKNSNKPNSMLEYQKCANDRVCAQVNICIKNSISY